MGQTLMSKPAFLFPNIVLPAIFLCGFIPSIVFAQAVQDAHTQVELISAAQSVRPGEDIAVAVRFRPDPGWHIYWKNPGESGLAPEIQWTLPPGARAGDFEWPAPQKIVAGDLVTYGYEEEILLTTTVHVPESVSAGSDFLLSAQVRWLACEVQCVPGRASLSLSLPVTDTAQTNAQSSQKIAHTRARLPAPLLSGQTSAVYDQHQIALRIESEEISSINVQSAYFFPEKENLIDHGKDQKVSKADWGLELVLRRSAALKKVPSDLEGVLLLELGGKQKSAVLIKSSLKEGEIKEAISSKAPSLGWAWALLFAFIGGLILNLMPCVLPVLSLKILSFVKEAHGSARVLRWHGIIFTAGVLVSFWILAGALLVLRAAGANVGWGFQLQSPVFVTVLSFIFFLFALNLFGLYEIGTTLTGAGQSWMRRGGWAGSFFSGVFATVVATPCTAPFMGAALGYTLSQPGWISLGVFTALGLGMASPYLILCSQPSWARWIPKPGAWMQVFKQALGIPLLATVAWLSWVLGLQKGSPAALGLWAGLACAALGVWVYGRWAGLAASRRSKTIATTLALVLIVAGLAGSIQYTAQTEAMSLSAQSVNSGKALAWETYSDSRLEQSRAQGKPVFIDFTAAWCLTCQVNERVALGHRSVVEAFSKKGIVALKADWTSQNSEIAAALNRYGRDSVPLYVFYGPKKTEPVILPEILTPSIVLEVLDTIEDQIQ